MDEKEFLVIWKVNEHSSETITSWKTIKDVQEHVKDIKDNYPQAKISVFRAVSETVWS